MTGPHNARTTNADDLAQSYGFEKIDAQDKQQKVDGVFDKVAGRYDLMNDLMSAGMHRLWKDGLVARLGPPKGRGDKGRGDKWRCLDVAGGTGDIAFKIIEAAGGHSANAHVSVFDINASMLEVGRGRAEKKGYKEQVEFIEGDAQNLPFADKSFDAYTISFGIRNVPHIDQALSEAYRVLKHGGRFLCLEFSEVQMPVLDRFYDQWSMKAIPAIGKAVAGEAEPYHYLVESIRKFPKQSDFANMIEKAGFSNVKYDNYSGGIAALHGGWKL